MLCICNLFGPDEFYIFPDKRYVLLFFSLFLATHRRVFYNLNITIFIFIQALLSNNYSSEYHIFPLFASKRRLYCEPRVAIMLATHEFFVSICNRVNINRYRHCIVKITAHSRKKLKPDCAGVSLITVRPYAFINVGHI